MAKQKRVPATHRADLHEAIVEHAKKTGKEVRLVTDEVILTGLSIRRIEIPARMQSEDAH
jgi:hypothetical protein